MTIWFIAAQAATQRNEAYFSPIRLRSWFIRASSYIRTVGRSPEAKEIIGQLDLDGPAYREYRRLLIDIIALARDYDTSLCEKLLGFPDSLPDLAAKRPRRNLKPAGVQQSFRARLKRGELPSVY